MPTGYVDTSSTSNWDESHVASWYAQQFGIPAAMVNKVGPWRSQIATGELSGVSPGLSAIVDSDGEPGI